MARVCSAALTHKSRESIPAVAPKSHSQVLGVVCLILLKVVQVRLLTLTFAADALWVSLKGITRDEG